MDSNRISPEQLEVARGWRSLGRDDRVTDEIEHPLGTMSVRPRLRSVEFQQRFPDHNFTEVSLFYRPPDAEPGRLFPVVENFADDKHDETTLGYEIGVFRTPAEAKIVGTLLLSPTDPAASLEAAGYEQTDERVWKRRHPRWADGGSSVYLGSDEDSEDISVNHRPNDEGAILCPLYLGRHRAEDSRPATSRGQAADFAAAGAFLHLIERTGHVRKPLDEGDWSRWASGQPILAVPGPVDTGPPRDLAFVLLSQEIGSKAKNPEKFFALNRLISDIKDEELPSGALLDEALEAFENFETVVPDWSGLAGLRESIGPRGDGAAHFVYSEHQVRIALIGITKGLDRVKALVEEARQPSGPRPS